jgi:hypothetical protein
MVWPSHVQLGIGDLDVSSTVSGYCNGAPGVLSNRNVVNGSLSEFSLFTKLVNTSFDAEIKSYVRMN